MRTTTVMAAIATAAAVAAGCGGDDSEKAKSIKSGAVVFRDALDDNGNGWLLIDKLVAFRGGAYEWNQVPPGGADALPAKLPKLPDGLATSVDVTMRDGAALRGVTCRELAVKGADEREEWYELGVDGRRALIRRMKMREAPKVLATADEPIDNGKKVRLSGRCVPDGKGGLLLSLLVDGKEAVHARDGHPLPAARNGKQGTTAIYGYARPDSPGAANLTWDSFEIRKATAG